MWCKPAQGSNACPIPGRLGSQAQGQTDKTPARHRRKGREFRGCAHAKRTRTFRPQRTWLITGQGWTRTLVGGVWQKAGCQRRTRPWQRQDEVRAAQKRGSKPSKTRTIEPSHGHNETHGGGLKYQSPIAKPTHHRHCGGLAQHGSSSANDAAGLGLAHWRGG